jgi:putative endonuclease
MHFVYFLKSITNGKYYVGQTDREPSVRLQEHNSGHNSWTKKNGPFELIYHESYACKEDARRRENFYKSGIGKRVMKAIIEIFVNKEKPTTGA